MELGMKSRARVCVSSVCVCVCAMALGRWSDRALEMLASHSTALHERNPVAESKGTCWSTPPHATICVSPVTRVTSYDLEHNLKDEDEVPETSGHLLQV